MTIPYNPLEYMFFTVHCPFGQFRRKNPSAGLYLHVSALVGEVARRHPNGPVAPLLGMITADVRDGSISQRNYDKLRYSLVHTDGRAGLLEHEHPMLGLLAFDTRCLDCKQQYSLSFHWSTSCSQFGG